ncbi:MAG: mercury transporter [Clostridiales bacterium]|nr:mercury transporter [Clostridiales bacterium]
MLIDELSKIMIGIIRTGVILRFTVCMIAMQKADDEMEGIKKRIINLIVFYIIAESIFQLKDILFYYFSNT